MNPPAISRYPTAYLADLRNAKTSPGNLLDSENTLIIFQEVAGPDLLMSKVGKPKSERF